MAYLHLPVPPWFRGAQHVVFRYKVVLDLVGVSNFMVGFNYLSLFENQPHLRAKQTEFRSSLVEKDGTGFSLVAIMCR